MIQTCHHQSYYLKKINLREVTKKSELFHLKGHGNEVDFLEFLHKPVRHRSITLFFEPFRFWLQIRGDISNRKTTSRLAESGSQQECL
jgi:hypothetical protein